MQEMGVWSLVQEDPLEKGMATKAVFLSGEFHGQRNLVGYSPWVPEELDMTERLHFHFSFQSHNEGSTLRTQYKPNHFSKAPLKCHYIES